jgi:hypothetical protein
MPVAASRTGLLGGRWRRLIFPTPKFEDVVKSAQNAAVLVLVY